MNKTQIEWVKNPDGTQGYTWNPITGCLNHTNGMCKGGGFPCYAYRLANGRLKQRYLANLNIAPVSYPLPDIPASLQPFYPRFWNSRLVDPYGKKPKGVFTCDMGELFGDWVPREWQDAVFTVIKQSLYNRYYLLTKQPQNLVKFSPFPDNCWVGVTATDSTMAIIATSHLSKIKAKVKFISFEPLLGEITDSWIPRSVKGNIIDWVIIGSQTKPFNPPRLGWIREIIETADKMGIAVFLKDNLLELVNYQSPETEFAFNKDGYYRQEIPE